MTQIAAIGECVIADRSRQTGKGNGGQRNAGTEHVVRERIERFGQDHGFQGSAALKCGMSNCSRTVGESKRSDRSTECKRLLANRCQAITKIELCQLVASDKASFADFTNAVVFDRNGMKIVTPCKCIVTYVLDCGGNQDGNDIMIVSKSQICDLRYGASHVLFGDNEMIVRTGSDA